MHRLGKAIADFDAATIETTHGFCLQVLYGLGTAGDVDREVTLVEDVSDLMDEVVDDLYLRSFASARTRSPSRGMMPAKSLARLSAIPTPTWCRRCPTGTIWKPPAVVSPSACARRWSARKRARKILTYDDVLLRLRDTLSDRSRDQWRLPALARALRRRPGRRVPGHRPRAVGHHEDRLRRGRDDARPHRRSQAGDLRLPRCRRPRLPPGAGQPVQSEWTLDVNWRSDKACSRPTTPCSRTPSSVTPASPTARSGPPRRTPTPGSSGARSPHRCACGSCTRRTASCPPTSRR